MACPPASPITLPASIFLIRRSLLIRFTLFSPPTSSSRSPSIEFLVALLSSVPSGLRRMLTRWSRAASMILHLGAQQRVVGAEELYPFGRSYAGISASAAPAGSTDSELKQPASRSEVKLNTMFWSKPGSLALPPGSPLRIEEPHYEGLRRIMLKLLLFYSKQSKSLRGANAVYKRIISQVDKPAIYDVFNLEKTFKATFSLLVLHMWLFLRRLKEEGKEGAEFGQYLYEIYNHDLEMRVSKAGVNLLLVKWMKELEKIFYGNIVAYDDALKPDAKHHELANAIWRNIFSDDGSGPSNDAATTAAQAMARYTRRESTCLSLTDKEAIFSGNFLFTSLELQSKYQKLHN